jgi:hypothetical protein
MSAAEGVPNMDHLVSQANHHWRRAWALRSRLKPWFNHRYPYWRRCLKSWCWRGQTADYRCWKHWSNDD